MDTPRPALLAILASGMLLTAAVVASNPSSSAGDARADTGQPAFDPASFAQPRDNPYFPLTPGLVTRLRGTDEGEQVTEVVQVTDHNRTILGVGVTVFRDVVRRPDGSLTEQTRDWYAADDHGNVWYFGEHTATYDEDGHLESREGSWQAGVDGAVPGILVPGDPHVSTATRPEFAKGVAEDQSWFVQHLAHVRTRGGRFDHVLRSFEWSRLEPGVISMKYYAAGLGIVAEHDVAGGHERFWLVGHHR